MKILISAAAALLLFSSAHSALAQGSLVPPGPPGPTMKSLDQIEARTPISSLPITISNGGSYYLTANLVSTNSQGGIVVAADNVTIDLNGFTLSGNGVGGEGISASGARVNLLVRNGAVRNWLGSGVNFYDSGSSQTIVQNIRSFNNGFSGIAIKNGSHAVDCITQNNGTRGIIVDSGCVIDHCWAVGNLASGLEAGANSQILSCQSYSNATGIRLTGAGNQIANNTVRTNLDNYNFALGNQLDLLLSQIPESIDWPANVKLTSSMTATGTNCITIIASGVTLDLGGFTLTGTSFGGGGAAILLAGLNSDITIQNGHIKGGYSYNGSSFIGSGFSNGVYYTGTKPFNVRVTGVSVSGCQTFGIYLGVGNNVVDSCTTQTIGGTAIFAGTVSHSTAFQCLSGINANTASDCTGEIVSGGGMAIFADTANNCKGTIDFGIGTGVAATVANNCYGYANDAGTGVSATVANGCYGYSYSGTGLKATTASSCRGESTIGTAQNIVNKYNMP